MNRLFICGVVAFLLVFTANAQYVHDILGDNYQKRTIEMGEDYEGRIICTLIRKLSEVPTQQAVLYIHGYNDYFFQSELGDSILLHGYQFYALDLRKYGRSLLPHQDAFYCKSLQEYFADIDTALTIIRQEGNKKIILMGHSTGGLISTYYLKHHPNAPIDGLVLNSPFLDWNFGWLMEDIVLPTVSFLGNYFPEWIVQSGGNPSYAYSLLKDFYGEWTFNTNWKMPFGHPKRAGWIHAIHTAQQDLQENCTIHCPILLLSSSQSYPESKIWHEEYMHSDIVLSVDDIQKFGTRLSPNVTAKCINGGIHDLFLSPKPARDRAYSLLFSWLQRLYS